jgi:hypothetical protein
MIKKILPLGIVLLSLMIVVILTKNDSVNDSTSNYQPETHVDNEIKNNDVSKIPSFNLHEKINFLKTKMIQKLDVILILIISLSISILIFFILLKRINKSNLSIRKIEIYQQKIKVSQNILSEEVLKLDNKYVSILEAQMSSSNLQSPDIDHDLIIKIINELNRIENNLSQMDPTIKGYKQLMFSIRRIKDNCISNDYQIVDMSGYTYDNGMKVIATFNLDDNLKEGEQKITQVIKPQINYRGKMIQKSEIVVSQNL